MAAELHVLEGDGGRCGATTRAGSPCRRQVSDGGVCPQHEPVPMSVEDAAKVGRRELLESLRDHIAREITEGVAARDLASLSKRLLDIESELDSWVKAIDGDAVSVAAATPDEPWGG